MLTRRYRLLSLCHLCHPLFTEIPLLGFLVERMTGQTLEHFMQEHIFLPLGMSSTTFYPRPDIVERLFRPCAMDPDTGELKAMTESPLGKPNRMEDLKLCLG